MIGIMYAATVQAHYNKHPTFCAPDLKGCKSRIRARSPGCVRRVTGPPGGAPGAGGAVEPHLVGGYHWDCSDWCGGGGALPGISEVAGSERPDSSSPASPPASPAPRRRARPPRDTHHAPDLDLAADLTDLADARLADGEPRTSGPGPARPTRAHRNFSSVSASSYLLHTDDYGVRAASDPEQLRARTLREPDAASLITMLGEFSRRVFVLPRSLPRTL